MKTIKELEAEETCHEDSYFKAGQIQAYEDVLGLIDELPYNPHQVGRFKKELKARIEGK